MKDITAILFRYFDSAEIYKTLHSLQRIESRLKSIIVLQELKMPPIVWASKLEPVTLTSHDYGQSLNEIIRSLTTSYVLFLQDTNYLSSLVHPDALKIPGSKTMIGTYHRHRDIGIYCPILLCTSLLKEEPFLTRDQLPFKEALFPAWLAKVKSPQLLMKEGTVRQSRINRSADTIQKERIMQKYQLPKTKMGHVTISVFISTYNMEKYLETAVVSCLLQNQTFDQILIMDDGSTDSTPQKLKRLRDEKQVKVFHKKNQGKARALNELLAHVSSDFIVELDADDWLDPDACSVIQHYLSDLPDEVSVLYGNLRNWKQTAREVLFKKVAKGVAIRGTTELLAYRFPLGPRIYRTSMLKKEGGFPVLAFEDGRLYEDVSVLKRLLKKHPFCYKDFTVYNVREHPASITKNNDAKWHDFLKILKSQ